MNITRRDFLKLIGVSGLALTLPAELVSLPSDINKPRSIKELLIKIKKEYKVISGEQLERLEYIGIHINQFKTCDFGAGWEKKKAPEKIIIPKLYDAICKKVPKGKYFIWRVVPEISETIDFDTGRHLQRLYTRFLWEI